MFDPDKDAANQLKHGVSLDRAEEMDFDTAIYVLDDRYDDGETRTQALGLIGNRLHMLVFTMRGDTLRAISLRKANPKEIKFYAEKT